MTSSRIIINRYHHLPPLSEINSSKKSLEDKDMEKRKKNEDNFISYGNRGIKNTTKLIKYSSA